MAVVFIIALGLIVAGFESAHLKYAVLATQNRYPHITADLIPMHTDIASTLENFAPLFYTALTQTYSGHT